MIQATSMSRLYKTQLIVMNHGWGLSGIVVMAIATDIATDFVPVIKRRDADGGTAMMMTAGGAINEMRKGASSIATGHCLPFGR